MHWRRRAVQVRHSLACTAIAMTEQLRQRQQLGALLHVLAAVLLPAVVPGGVAFAPDVSTPRWDPQHPDLNPGARPLAELGRGRAPATAPPVQPGGAAVFDLAVGRSVVAKGVGLLVRGRVPAPANMH